MCFLHFLRCVLCCDQDEEDQHFYGNTNYRDYSSSNQPIPRSISPLQDRLYRDDSRPLLPPACSLIDSRGNLKQPIVNSSHDDENRTTFSNLSSPSLSSSVRVSSAPTPSSSKPSFSPVSSTNNNISVAGHSIRPEKLQIRKDSATSLPDMPYTASQLSKFSSISSSAAPMPSSNKPSSPASSTNNKILEAVIPIGPEKLQILPERQYGASLLSKSPSSISHSKSDLTLQSKASSSMKPSSATISSTDSSVSRTPVVWKVKLPIPPNSTTKSVQKPSSSSPSIPFLSKGYVSSTPPSTPSLVAISTVNNCVSGDDVRVWQKKKQTSLCHCKEFLQAFNKVGTPDSSSSSETSSSSLEPRISTRRVLLKYEIPKYLADMIRNDIVPPVLKRPLSPSTYGDYFATLLFAEDFYIEKWSEYLLKEITLELRPQISSPGKSMKRRNDMQDQRDFVAFEIDSVRERRPYLLSRDFVFLKPLNECARLFKGILFRVVKSTILLVEFGDDFHSQHSPSKKYDVSFSFNRVCLKRAHQAISVASDPSFRSILFPDQSLSSPPNTFHLHENFIQVHGPVTRILNHKGPIPYLIEGKLSVLNSHQNNGEKEFSGTGQIILEAILKIYRTNPCCRILVCSPTNRISDVFLRSLMKEEIELSNLFRANATFRNYDLVPGDIIPASLYEQKEECFSCPQLAELLNFKVITCTFMSSFRLYAAGIDSEHFTHIFLVDASLATEPEVIVPLANLSCENTVIVVTGSSYMSPGWVRSDIGRRYGLKNSYFHRLLASEPYCSSDDMFIARVA